MVEEAEQQRLQGDPDMHVCACECGINVCLNVFYRCNNSYSDN